MVDMKERSMEGNGHITGCNRGTRYAKQKYSIGDHILEGFGTFGSLPTRLQTAR